MVKHVRVSMEPLEGQLAAPSSSLVASAAPSGTPLFGVRVGL